MNEANPNLDLIETLKSLKCLICNNILSIPPILTISENEYQCGRCKDIKYIDGAARNLIFERVANYLDFPCIHPNCDALVSWKDVQSHEKDCRFKTITCPMFHEECNEQIYLSDLTQHMVQNHGNNIFFENIVIPVPMFKSHVCVISVNSTVFLVYICSEKVIIASVESSEKSLTYTLKLQNSEQNSPTVTYEKQPVEVFDERKHCFRCIDNRCDIKYHPCFKSNKTPSDTNIVTSPDDAGRMLDKLNKKVGFSRAPSFKTVSLAATPKTKASTFNPIFQITTVSNTTTTSVVSNNGISFNSMFTPVCSTVSSTLFGNPTSTLFSSCTLPTNTTSSNTSVFGKATSVSSNGCISPLPSNIWYTGSSSQTSVNKNIPFDSPCTNTNQNKNICDTNRSVSNTNCESEKNDAPQSDNIEQQSIKCTKFNLSHIYNLIGVTSSITFTITINTNNEEAGNESSALDSFIPRSLLSTIDNSDLLRKTLECPICAEYMVDSIFLCERGHHICNNCKIVSSCPTCQGIIRNARSFALEDLAEQISLCCSSKERGCRFRGNLSVISEHEKNCDFNKTDSA